MWQSADDLLKRIDDEYSIIKENSYSYKKRNLTTSYVHAMLSNSFLKMINKSECFFLIESKNSIFKNGNFNQTYSPWLYTEIGIFNIVQKILRRETAILESSAENFRFPVNIEKLVKLNENILKNWSNDFQKHRIPNLMSRHGFPKWPFVHYLDVLYKIL